MDIELGIHYCSAKICFQSKAIASNLTRKKCIFVCNPCPCGWHNDAQKPCTRAHSVVTKYQKRISGPMLDCIDIHIEVPHADYEKLSIDRLGESSASIRERVQAARERQCIRFEGTDIVCPVQEPGLSQFRYARGRSASIL